MKFHRLSVTAHMDGTGIATNDGRLYLDGILEAVAARRAGTTFSPGDPPATFEIPLARVGDDNLWVWECSESRADWQAADLSHKVRAFASDRGALLDPKQRKINISGGEYKSYRLPLPIWLARSVTWRCRGNPELLLSMVNEIEWIGREHNRGRGRVSRWIVTIDPDEGPSPIWSHDGHPSRPLPVQFVERLGVAIDPSWLRVPSCGYRPPYWHPERRAECFMAQAPAIIQRESPRFGHG